MRPGPTDSPPPIPERLGRTRKRDGTHAIPSAGGDARARQIFENDLGIGQIPPTFSTARLHSKSTSASSEVPPQARVVRRFIGLPVLVCFLDIDVRVREEPLCSFCIRADVEPSFVNEKDIWVDIRLQSAFRHAYSAKAAISGGVFRRIFVEGSFIRCGGEIIDCRPVSAGEFRVTFDRAIFFDVRHRIVTLQNDAALIDVYLWFGGGFLPCRRSRLSEEVMITRDCCLWTAEILQIFRLNLVRRTHSAGEGDERRKQPGTVKSFHKLI